VPRALRDRVHVRTLRSGALRAELLAEAAIFVPALDGMERVRLEAAAAGAAIADPPGLRDQPELAGAASARLAERDDAGGRKAEGAGAWPGPQSFAARGAELAAVYTELAGRRRTQPKHREPLADRDWILADLHLHTSWSHDCGIEVQELLDHAQAE